MEKIDSRLEQFKTVAHTLYLPKSSPSRRDVAQGLIFFNVGLSEFARLGKNFPIDPPIHPGRLLSTYPDETLPAGTASPEFLSEVDKPSSD